MLTLTHAGLADRSAWEKAGICLPAFDPAELARRTDSRPAWIHFGPGNLFRGYVADLAQSLIESGDLETGIVAVKTTPGEIVSIYRAHDNLALQVKIHVDGTMDRKVIGSVSECLGSYDPGEWARLMEMARAPELAYISLTITEKGYQLRDLDGAWKATTAADFASGPDSAVSLKETPAILAAMLVQRSRACGAPVTFISMDNFSHNGEKLREAVFDVARAWAENGQISARTLAQIEDPAWAAFPNAVIDKITPGPDQRVADSLAELGLQDLGIDVNARGQKNAAFVNTEVPQYLVIEDDFPGGRIDFGKVGVYLTDRETADRFERMKVCTCLNPLHTALAVLGCLLDIPTIAQTMQNPHLVELVRRIGYTEGLPVVTDPGIIEPRDFLDTVVNERFPNPYVPDVPQRIATDTSQKLGIRFGETMKVYAAQGRLDELVAIPFVIAAWVRYLTGTNDAGEPMTPSPDPLLDELVPLARAAAANPVDGSLDAILSNETIFRLDLVKEGLAPRITELFRQMLAGPGAVSRTLQAVLAAGRAADRQAGREAPEGATPGGGTPVAGGGA
ncbi:MAG: mannitol dehydrogenase family protein [Bacillota bacterium]|nr:mannitol dehydrogenase family protein [Bacillota bacterium]